MCTALGYNRHILLNLDHTFFFFFFFSLTPRACFASSVNSPHLSRFDLFSVVPSRLEKETVPRALLYFFFFCLVFHNGTPLGVLEERCRLVSKLYNGCTLHPELAR